MTDHQDADEALAAELIARNLRGPGDIDAATDVIRRAPGEAPLPDHVRQLISLLNPPCKKFSLAGSGPGVERTPGASMRTRPLPPPAYLLAPEHGRIVWGTPRSGKTNLLQMMRQFELSLRDPYGESETVEAMIAVLEVAPQPRIDGILAGDEGHTLRLPGLHAVWSQTPWQDEVDALTWPGTRKPPFPSPIIFVDSRPIQVHGTLSPCEQR